MQTFAIMILVLPLFWTVSFILAAAHSTGLGITRRNRRIACLGLRDEDLLPASLSTYKSDERPRPQREMLRQHFSSQNYYARPNKFYAWFQRYLLHAPLYGTRKYDSYAIVRRVAHSNRRKTVIVLGNLPGRLQALYMLLYFALNTCLCLLGIDWSQRDGAAQEITRRSGKLCILNLIPLLLLACRNTPMLGMCGISDFTRITLHRWFGRLVVAEALCHSLAHLLPQIWNRGIKLVMASYQGDALLIWGTVATLASCVILVQTIAPIRHAIYETFYHLHVGLAAVTLVGIWIHCLTGSLPGLLFVQLATFVWLVEIALRISNIVFRNVGPRYTIAEIDRTEDENVTLVSLTVARPWKFKRGQFVYLTIPRIGWLTSHPFSVAWIDDEAEETRVNLLVRRYSGFTANIQSALGEEKIPRKFGALVQGPFGDCSFDSYGNIMFFASGVGITPYLMQIEHLQESRLRKTAAVLQIRLYWYVGSLDLFEAVRPQIKRLVDRQEYPDNILLIQLWTVVQRKGTTARELRLLNIEVKNMTLEYRQVKEALEKELEKQKGTAVVSVCGSGRFMDIVCDAVRKVQTKWNVDLVI